MLCCSAHIIYLLCSRRIVLMLISWLAICIQICMNKLLFTADNVERLFYQGVFMNSSKIHCTIVLLDNDCSYQSNIFLILLAFYLMLSVTYYAQNYAGIIGWFLDVRCNNDRIMKLDKLHHGQLCTCPTLYIYIYYIGNGPLNGYTTVHNVSEASMENIMHTLQEFCHISFCYST